MKIISVASSSNHFFLWVNTDTAFKDHGSVSVCRCGSEIGSLNRSQISSLQLLLVVECPHEVKIFTLNLITRANNCKKLSKYFFSVDIRTTLRVFRECLSLE